MARGITNNASLLMRSLRKKNTHQLTVTFTMYLNTSIYLGLIIIFAHAGYARDAYFHVGVRCVNH